MTDPLLPNKSVSSSILPIKHSYHGITLAKSDLLKHPLVDSDTPNRVYLPCYIKKQNLSTEKKDIVTAESVQHLKKKTSNDKLPSSEINSHITLLSQTLDQVLISKEKAFKPFWNRQSKEISEKLWLPIKIDCVDSVLNCSKESLKHAPMGISWFSIKEKFPHNRSSLMTSFPLSQFSLVDSTVLEVTPLKKKSRKGKDVDKPKPKKKIFQYKTIKGRLLPTDEEKKLLQIMMEQSRWYYNSILRCFNHKYQSKEKILQQDSFSYFTIRDLLTEYEYIEEIKKEEKVKYYQKKDDNAPKKQMCPPWWTADNSPHSRLPRGAAKKFSQNINSALSNYHNDNIKEFEMSFLSKKKSREFVLFEDKCFPAFIKKMTSQYWYTDIHGKKRRSSLSELCEETENRGLEIIYDKRNEKYYFCYPVEYNFYPKEDRRNENQSSFVSSDGERIISLDPGVRKFMVGYDPGGKMIFIGKGANKELIPLLLSVDQEKNPLQWKKIKDKVEDLHWKTISYLMRNYDHIIIPDFRISQMVTKKKITRMTKRLLYMFSYHSFILKLKYKCRVNKKKLYVVDESYTSKTCTECGKLNNVNGREKYSCQDCGLSIDRDVNGSRNIMIKSMK